MNNLKIIDLLNRLTSDRLEQQKLFCFAAALQVASTLELPVEPVPAGPHSYFTAAKRLEVENQMSFYNEVFVFDFKASISLVETLFVRRYKAAFSSSDSNTLLDEIITENTLLSQADREYMTEKQQELASLLYLLKEC